MVAGRYILPCDHKLLVYSYAKKYTHSFFTSADV